jgi:hypothetical protein
LQLREAQVVDGYFFDLNAGFAPHHLTQTEAGKKDDSAGAFQTIIRIAFIFFSLINTKAATENRLGPSWWKRFVHVMYAPARPLIKPSQSPCRKIASCP